MSDYQFYWCPKLINNSHKENTNEITAVTVVLYAIKTLVNLPKIYALIF